MQPIPLLLTDVLANLVGPYIPHAGLVVASGIGLYHFRHLLRAATRVGLLIRFGMLFLVLQVGLLVSGVVDGYDLGPVFDMAQWIVRRAPVSV